jgi:urea transporter
MKISDSLKTQKVEEAFSAAMVVIVLLILPSLGGVAMLLGSAIGLVTCAALYGRRHYERGGFRAIFPVLIALALGAAIALVLSRGH